MQNNLFPHLWLLKIHDRVLQENPYPKIKKIKFTHWTNVVHEDQYLDVSTVLSQNQLVTNELINQKNYILVFVFYLSMWNLSERLKPESFISLITKEKKQTHRTEMMITPQGSTTSSYYYKHIKHLFIYNAVWSMTKK